MGEPMSPGAARAALCAPRAPFALDTVRIEGIETRVWRAAPANLRAVFEASAPFENRTFLVFEDERLSYREHNRRVLALAHALSTRFGLAKGDRIAIAMRNYPEWSIAFWAAAVLGCIAVPLNAWWTGPELRYGVADCGARIVIADGERAERLAPHLRNLALAALIVARADPPAGALAFEGLLDEAPDTAALPPVEIAPEDPATIFYTSGTTGFPKGALGSQRNICSNLVSLGFGQAYQLLRRGEALPAADQTPPQRAVLLSVPFFHVTGCHSVLVAGFSSGAKIVLMYRWDPERALALIEAEQINSIGGVPAVAWQVMESPNFAKFDTSSLESIAYGGAPAAPDLVRKIAEGAPQASPGNGYGLTETSSVTTLNSGLDYREHPDSVGLPVPVCDVEVRDEAGARLPAGAVGEIHIKGPNVVKGYWNKPEASAETFRDGWLKTGDIGRIDADGFVYILDRAKDMLIRGGENIYCVEVEDALYDHPAVIDAAVVGLPHKVLGEVVAAAVQVTAESDLTEDDLRAHAAARIAAFKVPVRIDLRRTPLPRNPNGKILKTQVRDEIAALFTAGSEPAS